MDLPSISSKNSVVNILTQLKKEDGNSLVSSDEANNLANLKFNNGELILSLQERWFIYEIFWLLNKTGYTTTYNYLTVDWEKIFGEHNIRKKMLFENPLMSKTKDKFLLDMEIYRNKIDVVEGGEKCRRCHSDATVAVEKQTRSADEQVTIKIYCTSCKFKWTAQ